MGLASLAHTAEKRAMTPEDLFRLETVTDVVVSPDGRSLAYVVQRPIAIGSGFGRLYLWGNDRADVWVASTDGTATQNITNGESDGSGFWKPVWSPDSESLAMLSTRGGNVRLCVWRKSSGRIQLLSERGVTPWPFVTTSVEGGGFLWVSDHRLLFWVLPPGQTSSRMAIDTETPETAGREWAKARKGQESTASILESGVEPLAVGTHPQSQLLLADVASGKTEVFSVGPGFGDYDFATLRLAPDHRSVAFLRQVEVWRPDPARPVKQLINPVYEVVIADLDGRGGTRVLKGVREPLAGSLMWSPDSTEVAMIGYAAATSSEEVVFRCGVADGTCRPALSHAPKLDLHARNIVGTPPYAWFDDHKLLVEGEVVSADSPHQKSPKKWWTEDGEGHLYDFFGTDEETKRSPTQLVPDWHEHGLIGIIDGSVWRITAQGVKTKSLTSTIEGRVILIERPQSPASENIKRLVLKARRPGRDAYYLLDVDSGEIGVVPKPSESARLVGFDERGLTFAFTLDDDTGTYVYLRHQGSGQPGYQTLLQTNQFLRGIKAGDLKVIGYSGLDGQDLRAWVILPYGYKEGHRYPTVVWVQAGTVYGDEPPEPRYRLDTINNCSPLNLQLLAAHGYAVLMPSMPLKPYGEVDEPYMELTKGVLPAVEKLIDVGIADPRRLGIIGQSIGGYSTYGIITQTTRFRAAVASAGFSDLVSLYGTFDSRLRYSPGVHQDPFRMWSGETGSMGSPPWNDLERYIRNSPITYAERVETPLLIIQGDLDYVPMQQNEEFFTALYRQRKRAQFVRYWGEDHLLTSPANIRDMWERIYAWFDRFLNNSDHPNPE